MNVYFIAESLQFSRIVTLDPNQFVQEKMMDFLTPELTTFLTALGAIAVLRSLMRF
jgi:hypothetical protein